jgi:hypothetical protein
MKAFNTSDEFFDWFLSEIETHSPNYRELVINAPMAARQNIDNHAIIVQSLPTLNAEQMTQMFNDIRNTIKIPDEFYLVYDSKINTYASRFNTAKKRCEIICPTYAWYHLRYPPIIKAAMQHEMGHLLNKDYAVNTKGHSSCANQCMDIRINHHIDRDWLRDLFDAVYYFKTGKFVMLVPEETVENYGMRLKKHGTYSYQQIHKMYHLNDKDPQPKKKPPKIKYNLPEVGDVVLINKTNDYGKVTGIKDGKAIVEKMSVDEVREHFKKGSETTTDGGYSSME